MRKLIEDYLNYLKDIESNKCDYIFCDMYTLDTIGNYSINGHICDVSIVYTNYEDRTRHDADIKIEIWDVLAFINGKIEIKD